MIGQWAMLRRLVAAQERAQWGNRGDIGEVGGAGGGIGLHRAELDQHKRLLLTFHSRLQEQRGTGIKPAEHPQQQQHR